MTREMVTIFPQGGGAVSLVSDSENGPTISVTNGDDQAQSKTLTTTQLRTIAAWANAQVDAYLAIIGASTR